MPGSSDEIREGEQRFPFDPADRTEAGLCFIGRIRSPWSKGNCPKNLREARERGGDFRLELDEGYEGALRGLKVGQAIQVLYWVDRGTRVLAVQTPGHAPEPRGTFALRSPVRPNPVALGTSVITSLDTDYGIVGIDATDAFDGTPLLDIKPWIATVDAPPGWRPGA
ncbi:tRNA (N6-threonylcarbamoyladenosine(37)-N6)-methyltransferase TrmO [Rhodobacterales bacterium HKCCE2091]|nr:tRNA (N6-threonylcarbamoyladenosine(37)-N6)-methyltransferase TrmO [Rhodobacterales bacterium HKCCE2091]